jgi:hypothetical protein
MGLYTLTVVVWIAILVFVLIASYFYWRDQKELKKKNEERLKQLKEKKDSGKVITIIINEDGSAQIIFEDAKPGEKPPVASGRKITASYKGIGKEGEVPSQKTEGKKVFADRKQMIKFLGEKINFYLAERIPEEPGTYRVYLDVWDLAEES